MALTLLDDNQILLELEFAWTRMALLQALLPDNDHIPPSPVPLENHDKRLENPKWTYIITLISAAPCTWA